MKTFLQAAGLFLIFVLTLLIMSRSFGAATSDTELENTLETALEHALYVAMSENVYTIDDTEQLAADVMHELFLTCNIKADYTIAFNVIDLENGLLDVQVTQKVKSFPLISSEVVCRRTLIFDSSGELSLAE